MSNFAALQNPFEERVSRESDAQLAGALLREAAPGERCKQPALEIFERAITASSMGTGREFALRCPLNSQRTQIRSVYISSYAII